MMRSFLYSIAIVVGLGLFLAACNWVEVEKPAPQARAERRSVVLVTIDTLRADHVGAYGAEGVRTPNLDALAAAGTRFDQAIAPTPITLPSHVSLMTGLYPPGHGVRHNGVFALGSGYQTLAESFRASGYRTGAVVGAVVLASQFGLGQGFDHYDDQVAGPGSSVSGYPERDAKEVTDRALAWLQQGTEPFFLWVHYYDPHAAYRAPEPFATEFAESPYDGEIAYVDQQLGRLLAAADARAGGEALVAVTSDHGEGLGEHGEPTHSVLIYDSVLHVPMILRGPGVPKGATVSEVVSLVDVAPTLSLWAGLAPMPRSHGRDLRRHFDGQSAGEAWAYAESLVARLTMGWSPLYAIRDGRTHYIRSPDPELFDVKSDPAQLRNRFSEPEKAATVALAEKRLESLLGESSVDLEGSMTPLDATTRAQIESLGYALPIEGASADSPPTGLDFDPKQGLPWIEKALAAQDARFAGRLDLAEKWALQVAERFPESQRAHDILTHVYLNTRQYASARPHAEALARLAPHSAEHHARVGLIRLRTDDIPGSVAAFERALVIDPGHIGAHLGVMRKVALGGSEAEAEEHARYVLNHSAREIDYDQVGSIWRAGGQHERAAQVWQAGLGRYPDSSRLQKRLETPRGLDKGLESASKPR